MTIDTTPSPEAQETLAKFAAGCAKYLPKANYFQIIDSYDNDGLAVLSFVATLGDALVTMLAKDNDLHTWDVFIDHPTRGWGPTVADITDPADGLRRLAEKIEEERKSAAK